MDTDQLIETLAADARHSRPSLTLVWRAVACASVLLAAAVFFAMLGPRPDIAAAAGTPRFLFKFLATLSLAAGALALVPRLSRPDARTKALPYLAAAPLLLGAAVTMELLLLPADLWLVRLIGTNSMVCLTFIPLLGALPLVLFLAALRYGASAGPTRAGAVAGILAGAIAASFYAAHCTDDSPLFVAVWYSIAIAMLAGLGAIAARWLARW